MTKFNARTHSTGRIPSLRNKIVQLLLEEGQPVTALYIAMSLGIQKSAPYQPLRELVRMNLVRKIGGINGAEFSLDKEYYEYLKLTEPARMQ